MGKKKDKKGRGAEKTSQKTERNADKKQRKDLQKQGEDDIEKLIAEFQEQDRRRQEVIEEKCGPPSQRCNMSLTAHPMKEELIMFGGEFFNGKLTYLYNDLFFYNIKNNDWALIKSPNPPPPRCAHQAVTLSQDGGQLWMFGGEFASPSQSQFYHYKDLWVFSLRTKQWQQIQAPGAPTSRSGHRMVACKKLLLVFGGFHDNIRDYKYYNDLHAFNLETYSWVKLEVSGIPPAPRSACMMGVTEDMNQVLVYGGYSKVKVKRDVDQGKTHTDMFRLTVDSKCKQDSVALKWKWSSVKQSGVRPSARSGCTLTVATGNRGIVFGGVFDEEENEEEMRGVFYNDLYHLQLDNGKWFDGSLRGKKDAKSKRKRRKQDDKLADGATDPTAEDSTSDQEDMEADLENLQMEETSDHPPNGSADASPPPVESSADASPPPLESSADTSPPVESSADTSPPPVKSSGDNAVFTVTVGPQSAAAYPTENVAGTSEGGDSAEKVVVPGPRMNALMTVSHGMLYLYGGVYEVGDRQYTLADMYSLDLHKLDLWQTIIPCDLKLQKWEASSSEEEDEGEDEDEDDDEEEEEEEEGAKGGQEEDMDTESEEEEEEEEEEESMDEDCPTPEAGVTLDHYFSTNAQFWLSKAQQVADEEKLQVTEKQLRKAALRMAKDHFQQHR